MARVNIKSSEVYTLEDFLATLQDEELKAYLRHLEEQDFYYSNL